MNLIWLILVLCAHDSYSSSQKKSCHKRKVLKWSRITQSLTMLNDLCEKVCLCFFSNYQLDCRWFFQQTGKISSGSKIFWFDFWMMWDNFQEFRKLLLLSLAHCIPRGCSCTSSKVLQTTSMCVENELKSWRDCVFSVASPQNMNVGEIFFNHVYSEYSNTLSSE